MGQPWGLSGPQFLGVYIAAIVIAAFLPRLTGWLLHWLPEPPGPKPVPGPFEIAYLNGGRARVAQVVLTELVDRGALRVSSDGKIRVAAAREWAGTAAERYEIRSTSFASGIPTSAALDLIEEAAAIRQMKRALRADGLLLSVPRATAVRVVGIVAAVALTGTGIARLAEGLSNHRPTDDLMFLFIIAVIISLWLALAGDGKAMGRPTRRGDNFRSPLAAQKELGISAITAESVAGVGLTDAVLLAVAFGGFTAVPDPDLRDAIYAGIPRRPSSGAGGVGLGGIGIGGGGCGGGGGGGGGCGG